MIFVGIGYDIHRLKRGRKLYLGGIEIKYGYGLIGHSDADVILHAICDAMLGAAGLKDIGHYFPPKDEKYKNISSKYLLQKTNEIIKNERFKVVNVDTMVIIEKPKIKPYIDKMRNVISQILGTKNINIKSTTNEGIGVIGKGRAIACFSVVSLKRRGGRVA